MPSGLEFIFASRLVGRTRTIRNRMMAIAVRVLGDRVALEEPPTRALWGENMQAGERQENVTQHM